MDFLSPEIKVKIFNQLPIRDSIKCRQVCKDWLVIIDSLKYRSLEFCFAIHERSEEKDDEKETDLWISNFEKFFRAVTIDPKFSRIKVMIVSGCLPDLENLDVFINHFDGLEELYLDYARYSTHYARNLKKFVLNLKFLTTIKFSCRSQEVITSLYKLETPSLTHLMTGELSNIEICYPEKIKCLEVKNNTPSLAKFKNLKILIIIDYFMDRSNISKLSAYLLHQLPHLKRVYAGWNAINNKLVQTPIEGNSDLEVYYFGFRINSDLSGNFDWKNIKDINKLYSDCEWTSFMARNYAKSIDDNPYFFPLDYTQLLKEFDQNVPNDFWEKFSKFHSVRIRNLEDEVKILNFLDSNEPMLVIFKNPTISRSFLEQLSKFSFINHLEIRIDEWPTFLDDFNFDFKNEEIKLDFEIHCSLKSLKPAFEVFERAKSYRLRLEIVCDKFKFILGNDFTFHYDSSVSKWFTIMYMLNGNRNSTSCIIESFDLFIYLDRQVPRIVELKDKLRLFSIVKEYDAQRRIAEKIREKLYRNSAISIKF